METPLAQQSPALVLSNEEQIMAFVLASYPTLDLSPGTALRDIVIKLYAHLEVRIQEQIDLALISSSMLEISKNPGLVDDTQVDRVLSNFNVTRSSGSTASGLVRLYFSSGGSKVLSQYTNFTIGGLVFTPTASYVLVSAANFTGASTQRILELTGSLYSVVIPVTCTTSGSTGNVRASTSITQLSPAIATFVSGKADSDFTGGSDEDDNVSLLTKVKTGVVGKVFGGREHIKAKLKTQFNEVVDAGVVGFLDPEMSRDLVNGVHLGNRVDLYVKTANYPSRITVKMPCQMISYDKNTKQAVLEVVFSDSQSSGMYVVDRITPSPTQFGSLEIIEDNRTLVGNSLHFIGSEDSRAFSSYQKTRIRFLISYDTLKETATPLALNVINFGNTTGEAGSNPWYDYLDVDAIVNNVILLSNVFLNLNPSVVDFFFVYAEYLQMPNLQEVQGYVDSAEERSLSADMLVKAPIPIMCSMQFRLLKSSSAEAPDLNKLKSSLVSKFNSFEMGSNIPASALIHTIYQNIPSGYTVDLPVHMYGVIINPDLSKDVIYSSDTLRAPKNYSKGISPNTCAFFLESSLIDVSIVDCP